MTAAFGNATLSGNATINVAAGLAGAATQVTLADVGETGGARSLTKSGPGTLIINGAGTFTGGLIINDGILRGIGTSPSGSTVAPTTSPFGSNTLTLNGGTLQVRDNGDATTASQSLTYLNPVIVNGDATVNVDRAASPATTKTIRFGRLTLADGVTFTTSASNSYAQFYNSTSGNINTLLGDATFNVTSGTTNLGYSGSTTSSTNVSLTDGGGNFDLTKTGNGTLALGRTTVGGLVQVDAGILQLNSAGNLLPGGILVNGGTLLVNAGNGVLGAATSPDVQVAEGSLVRLQNTTGAQNVGFDFQGSATLSLRASSSVTFQVESLDIEAAASEFTFSVVRSTSTGDPNNHTMTFQGPITTNGQLVFNATGSNGYQAATSASSTLALGGDITFNPTTTNLTLNGVVSEIGGARSLTKMGESTLTLSAANTYSGGTSVNSGTLLVNNTTGSGTGFGNVTVDPSATLGGSGIIASTNSSAAVTVQGLLDVGNVGDTAGSDLVINLSGGSSTFNLSGPVQLDLWSGLGSGGGTGTAFSDQLWVSANTIDLTGSSLKLMNSSGFANSAFAVGDTWKLFDWSTAVSVTGTFSNITSGLGNFTDLPDLDAYGLAWDTSALYTTGNLMVVIPEPGRAVLLLLGLMTLGLRRRRRTCCRV
jgi:autotransporter-associated beta strand protein